MTTLSGQSHRSAATLAGGVLAALTAVAAMTTTPAQAQSATYEIDPSHTFVHFEIKHFGTSTNRGRFDRNRGTVSYDRTAKTGSVDITVETRSVNTGFEPFTKALISRDFLNSAEHPQARFTSNQFVFEGDKLKEIVGQLTLLGRTHPVTLTAVHFACYENPLFKREVCGGDFEAKMMRSRWGINWGLDRGFPDDMRLVIQVEAIKQ
jgi:polyisoprenoid-binding protein YceI